MERIWSEKNSSFYIFETIEGIMEPNLTDSLNLKIGGKLYYQNVN